MSIYAILLTNERHWLKTDKIAEGEICFQTDLQICLPYFSFNEFIFLGKASIMLFIFVMLLAGQCQCDILTLVPQSQLLASWAVR